MRRPGIAERIAPARPAPLVTEGGSATVLPLRPAEVDVWRAALDQQPDEVVQFLQGLLSSDESHRAAGFYFERDRRRFVVGRGILRILLSRYLGCTPQQIRLCYGANGKPALSEPAPAAAEETLHFNVAHSEGLALFAFTRAGEVGIDVESMRDLPDWPQVAEASFSPHELAQLRACPAERRRDEFFRAWTRQEAVLKALGTGLGAIAETGAESAFNVYPLDAGPGFAAALACSPAASKPLRILGWGASATRGGPRTPTIDSTLQTNFP
jgi:phosphopantetheinyl transferase